MENVSKYLRLALLCTLIVAVAGCPTPDGSTPPPTTYAVIYNGNNNTGGSVPTDTNKYQQGAQVVVIANNGNLSRAGCTYAGWNTKADGSGTAYTGGSTFTMGISDVTLYAAWTQNPTTFTVTYNANGGTGSVPTDNTTYTTGAIVPVLFNTGMAVSGSSCAGWTTSITGPGASYAQGATFTMGTANVTLSAVWINNNLSFNSSGTSITITGYGTAPTGSLTIPWGVTGVAGGAVSGGFQNSTGLTDVSIPSSVTSIGEHAFYGCSGLTSITIPSSVTSIGLSAFENCSGLSNVYEQATTPPALGLDGDLAFYNDASVFQIHVPSGTLGAYFAASGWSAYAAYIVSP
jgi:BspA type Leucine rich repeat region (6 copies)/Listeria-Bacteroides repeat domain (List_Bact_rpt)